MICNAHDGSRAATGVVAVIAAFRPDRTFVENVGRVVHQVDHVVVVDDGSGPRWDTVLGEVANSWSDRAEVLHLDRNSGIAAALNTGLRRAFELGASMVLTLDQDSQVRDDYVAAARDASRQLRARGREFAAVAAGVQSGRAVRSVIYEDRGEQLTPTLEAIQSGLLIPRTAIDILGMFDESLFIDCVDTDFVVRAARAGLPTYLARACEITHPLGRAVETRGIRATRSGTRTFAFHPPWRRYYISRNRAVMLGRHGLHEPRWATMSIVGETVQFIRSLVFGPDKRKQAIAFALGVTDAARGRRGKLQDRTAAYLGASS